jgi:hypothetical protein
LLGVSAGYQYSFLVNETSYDGAIATVGMTSAPVLARYGNAKRHLHRTLIGLDWWRVMSAKVRFLALT